VINNTVFGREAEQAVLAERLAAARRGEGSVVLVEGDGGEGKSALVSTLIAAARAEGCPVLFGRSWELSSSVPYEPFVAAISRFLRSVGPTEVARLTAGLPTLGTLIEGLDLLPTTGAPEAYKARLQDAVATLVARIGADKPVVLVLDDFHWADQASLEILQYLCLDLPDTQLVVALTVRPQEAEERPDVRRLLAVLRRSAWTTSLSLNRLDRAAVDAVVASRLDGEVEQRIYEAVASRSGGTPLLIHELIDDLVSRAVVGNASGVWRLLRDDVPVARSARDLIRTRLDRVEPHDRAVLESLAIINGPTDPAVVALLVGADAPDVEAALERLRSNRLAAIGGHAGRDPTR
jgi:predicted ATPase